MEQENHIKNISFEEADQRAQEICKKMTLKEKIDYIGGINSFSIRSYPQYEIPEIIMSDGPTGCHRFGKATAFPASILLAATFDPNLAAKMGEVIAKECRTRGIHILLAPGVNIYRSPQCSRNFEYLGEDPYLAAAMAVEYIRGVQEQGVIATVKHFACNNQDCDRYHTSSEVDERTLHEIYFPAFKAAVQKGKVKAVMTAYNLLNGVHCSENDYLVNKILKKEWQFKGFVMSDWDSVYDTEGPVNNGLDIEMPYAKFMNYEKIMPLFTEGKIKESVIDDKIIRILRSCILMGFIDRAQTIKHISWDNLENNNVSLDIARAGTVLLKNDNILPFKPGKIKRIALIGPNVHPAVIGGGGSSYQESFRSTSIKEGITEIASDDFEIIHIESKSALKHTEVADVTEFYSLDENGNTVPGLKGEYYSNEKFTGTPHCVRFDRHISFDWNNQSPMSSMTHEYYSVRWTGFYLPSEDGNYEILAGADDGIRVWIDSEIVLEDWGIHGLRPMSVRKKLKAGKQVPVKVEYFQDLMGAAIYVGIRKVEDSISIPNNVDAVVACLGFNSSNECEGADRSFELPAGQEDLILNITKANPNVVVVLNAGGSVATKNWIDKIKGLVYAFYGGQEGGTAVAEILFGKINPSGKLPFSFEKKWEDNASYGNYPGVNKKMQYKEGIFIGYRHFDEKGIEPLFPFGYGLSYTTFKYSNLSINKNKNIFTITFEIKNTGRIAGTEIAQIYISDLESSLPRPKKELKGFARVYLKPGQKKKLKLFLNEESFAFYNPDKHSWVVERGQFLIQVGASSRNIRLGKEISV